MVLENILKSKLKTIKKVIDFQKLFSVKGTEEYIKKYYKYNQLSYSFFQNSDGFFHFGVNKKGKNGKDDVLFQPRLILKYAVEHKCKNILELGMGRGSNLAFLARNLPDANFCGIDFSTSQLKHAMKKAKKLPNFFPQYGNYQDIKTLPQNKFDIIFAIETVCYSVKKEKDFKGFDRLLKEGGRLIIFDGYRTKAEKDMKPLELLAVKLTEKGMAFERLDTYKDTKKAAVEAGLRLESEEDLSKFVLPNLAKLEKISEIFFRHPKLAKILNKIFPDAFIFNAVSAYLMPILVKKDCFCYMQSVFIKPRFKA